MQDIPSKQADGSESFARVFGAVHVAPLKNGHGTCSILGIADPSSLFFEIQLSSILPPLLK